MNRKELRPGGHAERYRTPRVPPAIEQDKRHHERRDRDQVPVQHDVQGKRGGQREQPRVRPFEATQQPDREQAESAKDDGVDGQIRAHAGAHQAREPGEQSCADRVLERVVHVRQPVKPHPVTEEQRRDVRVTAHMGERRVVEGGLVCDPVVIERPSSKPHAAAHDRRARDEGAGDK